MAFKGACLCDDFRRAIKMDSANPSITDKVSLHRECVVRCPVTQGTPIWKGSCWWHQNFAFIWSPARPHFSNVSTKSCCNFVSSHWPLPFCYLKVEQFPFLAAARLWKLLLPGGLLSSVHMCVLQSLWKPSCPHEMTTVFPASLVPMLSVTSALGDAIELEVYSGNF